MSIGFSTNFCLDLGTPFILYGPGGFLYSWLLCSLGYLLNKKMKICLPWISDDGLSPLPPSVYLLFFCTGIPVRWLRGGRVAEPEVSSNMPQQCQLNFYATFPLYCTNPREGHAAAAVWRASWLTVQLLLVVFHDTKIGVRDVCKLPNSTCCLRVRWVVNHCCPLDLSLSHNSCWRTPETCRSPQSAKAAKSLSGKQKKKCWAGSFLQKCFNDWLTVFWCCLPSFGMSS